MAIVEVKVPQLSESVSEATMLQWKKKPGEAVAQDEILIEIEIELNHDFDFDFDFVNARPFTLYAPRSTLYALRTDAHHE